MSYVSARLVFHAVAFQVSIQACPSNSQDLCCPQPVAFANFQYFLNMLRANFIKRKRPPISAAPKQTAAPLQLLGQVGEIYEFSRRRMQALEITFSSSRTFPGQECWSI